MRAARRLLLAAMLTMLLLGGGSPGTLPPTVEAGPPEPSGLETEVYRDAPGVPSRPAATDPCPLPENIPTFFSRYPTSAELLGFLDDLEAEYPNLAERFLAGISWQGKFIPGLRLGNEQSGDPDARPALYLDGQHHAREAISAQSVLYAVWWMLARYGQDPLVTHLLDTKTVYAIPMVNVDGNDHWLRDDFAQRRNANPTCCDDDGDGQVDEDPANGMGFGTHRVTRYTFDALWVALHPDNPFVEGWQAHLLSTQDLGVRDAEDHPVPQIDDDGDGAVNEDPVGGVDLNRNYDAHWELGEARVNSDIYRGPVVWSELESRAVRDTVYSHTNILMAASLHSGADVVLHPWGWSSAEPLRDGQVFERLARKGSQLTECCGYLGAGHTWTARGLYVTPGSTMDWLYFQGIYALTPEIYGAGTTARVQRDADPAHPNSFLVYRSDGLAFSPQPDQIVTACERWREYLVYLLAAVPSVRFTRAEAQDGALVVGVANEGGIAVDVELSASSGGQVHAARASGLRGREFLWRLPLVSGTATVTATMRTLIATGPRVAGAQTVCLRVEGQAVEVLSGDVRPFVRIADAFGGWDADARRWDPGYHWGPQVGYTIFFPVARQ